MLGLVFTVRVVGVATVAVGTAAAATWFRGVLLDPDYRTVRSGRVYVRMSALDLSDALREVISVASMDDIMIDDAIDDLLDGVGWPDDAIWRDIDADLLEILSRWEHTSGRGINGLQALTDTVGPPARSIICGTAGLG